MAANRLLQSPDTPPKEVGHAEANHKTTMKAFFWQEDLLVCVFYRCVNHISFIYIYIYIYLLKYQIVYKMKLLLKIKTKNKSMNNPLKAI